MSAKSIVQLGPRKLSVIRSREVAAKRRFLNYYSELRCIVGTKVSVCHRQGGRSSEVVAKRGSTVMLEYKGENPNCNYFWIIVIYTRHVYVKFS